MRYDFIVLAFSLLMVAGLVALALLVVEARGTEAHALSLLQDCLNSKPLYLQDDYGKTTAFILCEVSKEIPA